MKTEDRNNLMEIFASSPIDAQMVSSLLKDSGIESFLRNEHMGTLAPWQVTAGGVGAVAIMVNSKDFEAAKTIIEKYKQSK